MAINPAISDITCPPGLAPKVVTLEAHITSIQDGPRHMFNFSYDGKECYCFVLSRLFVTETLQVGQTVRLTGDWSAALLNVFDALSVTVLE